ncbi:tol-pal system protein YbgF [Methylopila capsulata]|nr:tol-pal system protein YbgF [Methylopila capsulata]MBM7852521.1 tol-pal system protein YbgF [Methylopila capsulata]
MFKAARSPFVRRLALGAVLTCAPFAAAAMEADAGSAPSWLETRVEGLETRLAFFGAGREERPAYSSPVQPAQSSSLADIAVRLDRLENQMRQLNGRLDEIQFQTKRNDEALKRFQGDVDFRLQDLESGKGGGAKPGRRGDAGGGATVGDLGAPPAGRSSGAAPSNLGAPRGGDTIGGLIDDGGPGDDPNAPMSIRPPGARQSAAVGPTGAVPQGGGGMSVGTGDPRDQFDMGVGFIQRRDYELADSTFRDFLRAYPKDPRAAEAQYWLGESLYQRKKYTDAADSFYKIYVDAPQSAKAPESMMKLGMALNGMGKKDEACATIAEAGKKYARIKPQTDRELKRISC